MTRPPRDTLLLGEWACLGLLYPEPAHGFAIAARLRPDGDVGRVWSLSRPLTYRSIAQLSERGYIEARGEEPGAAGPNRTILAATRAGRSQFRRWIDTPVEHLRDLRSELLLKLVLADICDLDITELLTAQRAQVAQLMDHLDTAVDEADVVGRWRREIADAALRFLDAISREA